MGIRNRRASQIIAAIIVFFASDMAFSARRPVDPPSSKVCAEIVGGQSQELPKISPIILKPLDRLFDGPNYLYEMKYDGFRGVAYFEKGRGCRIISRNSITLSQFQNLCQTIAQELDVQSAIFDGEVIAPDPSGRPSLNRLLRREEPFQYVAFDLMWLNGEDLRAWPLEARREKLLEILPKSSHLIVESLAQVGSGIKLYDLMVENDLEGIVIKRLTDKYLRTTKWYKFKNPGYSRAPRRKVRQMH